MKPYRLLGHERRKAYKRRQRADREALQWHQRHPTARLRWRVDHVFLSITEELLRDDMEQREHAHA